MEKSDFINKYLPIHYYYTINIIYEVPNEIYYFNPLSNYINEFINDLFTYLKEFKMLNKWLKTHKDVFKIIIIKEDINKDSVFLTINYILRTWCFKDQDIFNFQSKLNNFAKIKILDSYFMVLKKCDYMEMIDDSDFIYNLIFFYYNDQEYLKIL